jgi:hypothetical protein
MILPSKHLPPQRALLTLGAKLLRQLDSPKTVSTLWEAARESSQISFDWFVLALDVLYAMEAIDIQEGLISKKASS